jgi:hypothetical protein
MSCTGARPRLATLFLTALLALGLAAVPASSPAAVSPDEPVVTTDHYAFYSHPWVSLHQFLYQWARAEEGERLRYAVAERDTLGRLPASDRAAWQEAVAAYREDAIGYDLRRSDLMRYVRRQLQDLSSSDPDALGDLPFNLDAVLRPAMRVYQAHWWDAHRAANRALSQSIARRLRPQEDTLVARLEHAYGGTFPEDRVPIYVSPYTNWAGAYTTVRPLVVNMAAQRFDAGGDRVMETLIHETAHSVAFSDPLADALREAFAPHDVDPPDGLLHTVIFYTSGELTRKHVVDNASSFEHYGARYGLYDREPRASQVEALRAHWTPFLDGALDRETAYRRIAEALAPSCNGTSGP